MSELPNETWTSAYLDGELTAAECAQFERWLAGNPAAQQLLDELRSVSRSVQALPRETLGPDFAKRVLERAELTVLLPKGDAVLPIGQVVPRPLNDQAEATNRPWSGGIDWGRWSRPLLWSAMATAAALMITFFSQSSIQPASKLARVESKDALKLTVEAPAPAGQPFDTDSDSILVSQPKSGERPMLKKESIAASPPPGVSDLADSVQLGIEPVEINAASAEVNPPPEMPADEPLAQNLVVFCCVTPQAAEDNYFAQVLVRNSVSVDVTKNARGVEAVVGESARDEYHNAAAASPAEPDRGARDAKESAQSAERQQTVYLVEASQRQIANVLAELQNDRTDVLAVNVDPAPRIPAQRPLALFCRGYDGAQMSIVPAQNGAAGAPADNRSPGTPASLTDSEERLSERADKPARRKVLEGESQQSPKQRPAEVVAGEQPSVDFDSAAAIEDQFERTTPNALYSQNQIRQQIPLEEQRQLLVELRNLSTQIAAEPGRFAVEYEKSNVTQQTALPNNSRARQIELPRFSQIDAGVQLQELSPDFVQRDRREPALNQAKPAAEPPPHELSGGGGATKGEPRGRSSGRRAAESPTGPTAAKAAQPAQQSQPQSQPLAAAATASAPPTDGAEPLVKAVFVIQAGPAVAAETAPANQSPAPNAASSPAKAGPP